MLPFFDSDEPSAGSWLSGARKLATWLRSWVKAGLDLVRCEAVRCGPRYPRRSTSGVRGERVDGGRSVGRPVGRGGAEALWDTEVGARSGKENGRRERERDLDCAQPKMCRCQPISSAITKKRILY